MKAKGCQGVWLLRSGESTPQLRLKRDPRRVGAGGLARSGGRRRPKIAATGEERSGGRRRPKIAATGEERSGYLFKSDVPYFVMREQVSMSLGISVRQYVKISDKRSRE
jgi:hypothetical protein